MEEYGLDGVNPPFAFEDEDLADIPDQAIVTPPQPQVVEEKVSDQPTPQVADVEENESEAAAPPEPRKPARPPMVVGTRRRAPAQAAEPIPEPVSGGMGCADLVTAIFLLLTVGFCAYTLLLIIYPRSPLNPLPAPTFPAQLVIASPMPTDTPTDTFTPLPATDTPTATSTATPTATFTVTWTPTPTFTPVVGGLPSATSGPTSSGPTSSPAAAVPQFTLSPYPFTVDPLRYTSNTGPDGCNWQSIVVIVKDQNSKPIKGIAFRVMDSGGNIDEVDYTGNVPRFGDGSYELLLGTVPRQDQLTVQVLSRNGQQISDTVTVATHTDCKQNVVVVTFAQNHEY